MIQNELFRDCLAAIPAEQKAEFDLSFGIAERISEMVWVVKLCLPVSHLEISESRLLSKRAKSFWVSPLAFSIARIETALGSKLISIAHWLAMLMNILTTSNNAPGKSNRVETIRISRIPDNLNNEEKKDNRFAYWF